MFSRRIFVIAFALFTVTTMTACPRDIANKIIEKNELTKEYNEKVDQANSISLDLAKQGVSVDFGPLVGNKLFSKVSWVAVSASDRLKIRNLLTSYLHLIGRIIELANHGAIKDDITDTTRKLQKEKQANAKAYMDSLNSYEGAQN
jgi:hypothetical protein